MIIDAARPHETRVPAGAAKAPFEIATGSKAIGVFDSGIGGLSVMREIVRQLPGYDVYYVADSAHVPYGERSMDEIQDFSEAIARFLIAQGAAVIVVACNTASAAALYHLRGRFSLPFVGMEPAIKPAAERSQSQNVGVIATQATFQGELFARLVERFAADTTVHTQACPGLVKRVEDGLLDDEETEAVLRHYLEPMLEAGIDTLVLGCTHYPFLRPAIERVTGPGVRIIDPAPAVARQTGRILGRMGVPAGGAPGTVTYYTSGNPAAFASLAADLAGIPGSVIGLRWAYGAIFAPDWFSAPSSVMAVLEN